MFSLKGRLLAEFGAFLGNCEQLKLRIYAKRANFVQEKLLLSLMKVNKNTAYGKKNGFDKVKSIEDYQKTIPLTNYYDYDEYVWRMADGEKKLLTNIPVRRFTESSGSTGKSKLVPLSAWAEWVCQCFGFSAPVGCTVKWFKQKGKRLPPQKGLLTAESSYRKLPSGKTISCLSSIPLLNISPVMTQISSSPRELLFPPDEEMDMHYLKLRFGLQDKKVSYIGTVFITSLESMFYYMEHNWEMLCDDIEKGTINPDIKLPDYLRKKFEKKLKPMPERAEELRSEFRKDFDESPIVPRVWPNIGWMYGMGTGSLSLYAKKLKRYMGDDIPIHYLGYAATEAMMAVPIELNSFEYVILPQNAFFEFRPIEKESYDNLLTIKDLEVGKEYEVILTNTSGFYRYRIEDVIRVTGYYYESPKITFCYRLNQIANISGEKISQMAFDEIVDNLSVYMDEPFMGYSIYADRSTSPGHYILYLETVNEISDEKKEKFPEAFEKMLCKGNVSVEPMIKSKMLGHCEVRFLQKGTYEDYRMMLKKRGANLNQIKPIKVLDTEEKRAFFEEHLLSEANV